MNAAAIIDAHTHYLDSARFSYRWLDRRPDVARRFLEEDYRAATGGVDVSRIVLVEAAVQDADAIEEAEWLATTGARTQFVGAIVAQARLERGAAARDELDRIAQLPKVTGIRRVVRAPFQTDPDFCIRPDFVTGVRLLAEYDFTFDVACGPGDLSNVSMLADACPDVRLVVNHIANPPSEPAGFASWRDGMRNLAQRPNVTCKISGQQTHLPAHWDARSALPFVEPVVEAFGPLRIVFGSDTPVQNAGGGLAPWFKAMNHIFAAASESERNLFFGGNARRIYRIV